MVECIFINSEEKTSIKDQVKPTVFGINEKLKCDLFRRVQIDKDNLLIIPQETHASTFNTGFEVYKNKVFVGRYAGNGVILGNDKGRLCDLIKPKEKFSVKYYQLTL